MDLYNHLRKALIYSTYFYFLLISAFFIFREPAIFLISIHLVSSFFVMYLGTHYWREYKRHKRKLMAGYDRCQKGVRINFYLWMGTVVVSAMLLTKGFEVIKNVDRKAEGTAQKWDRGK